MRNTLLTYCILFTFAMVISAQEQNPPVSSTIQHRKAPDIQQNSNNNSIQIESASWRISQYFQKFTPIKMSMVGLNLLCDTNSLQHDIDCSIEVLNKSQVPVLSANLINVTGGSPGYRILPNGEHFTPPATLEIEYDANSLPIGFKPNDVYTYYYNENMQRWEVLPRIGIDTTRQMIISETTHFTDFINAVIRTPDMPEVNAFVPTALQDIETPHPFECLALIKEPQVNCYGSAQITYPIEIPMGRNGLQPDVSLSYNSTNGNGLIGYGWNIPQFAMTLDTRWGVPRYDNKYESEIYCLNGMQCVLKDGNPELKLPYQTNTQISRQTGKVQFIARDTRNCDKIIRHGSNPKNYWWEVIGRDGTISYYGKYAKDNTINRNCVLKDANGNIGYWALAEVVDISGNYIRYEYIVSSNNEIYPKFIYYTGHKSTDNAIDLEPSYRIFFHYDQRADILQDGRLGFVRQTDSIMCYIDITYLNNNTEDESSCWYMNHRFLLQYDENPSVSLLNQIQDHYHYDYRSVRWPISDECNISKNAYEDILNGVTNFDYYTASTDNIFSTTEDIIAFPESTYTPLNKSENSSWNIGGTATVGFGPSVWQTNLSAGGNYNYSKSNGTTKQMLLDINGDGLTDIVYIKNNTIYFRPQIYIENHPQFGNEINTGIPAKGLSVENSETHTWGLQTGAEAYAVSANLSGGESYTNTYVNCYFSDVNGDGLPDYVSNGKVYFNSLNTNGGFVAHTGESEVIIDSTRCTNFFYDGEIEVVPDCIIKDSIVNIYVVQTPNCSLRYQGTEPDYLPNSTINAGIDCEECRNIILDYLHLGLCPIDLHSMYSDYAMRHTKAPLNATDNGAPSDDVDYETIVPVCLRYCDLELVCEECLERYEYYLLDPNPNTWEEFQTCKQENGCRTICNECFEALQYGYDDEYFLCADTFCLNGRLQEMHNPCNDCHDICLDDINNCKDCIDSNPTCFVCDECQDICVNDPENCNQCKLEYNCLGAIPTDCENACLYDNYYNDPYSCYNCIMDMEAYCEECRDICQTNPEFCLSCINRHCHYDNSIAYINECWNKEWNRYYAWEKQIKQQYNNIIIENRGNNYYAHQIDTICPEKSDPEIEAVRVWVAPKNGTITLNSSIELIQDTSSNRQQSRQVDGVRCLIQHNNNITINEDTHTLQANNNHIIDLLDIAEDDYTQKNNIYSDINVKKGDVFFFHLRSVRTHHFDNINWEQTFTYADGDTYSSKDDFICYSDNIFQTEDNGTIIINTDIACSENNNALLKILINNQVVDSVTINSSITHNRMEFAYQGESSVALELSSTGNIGNIIVQPHLTFKSHINPDYPPLNLWLSPRANFEREVELDSLYYNLFGPLYRGWGQFAYNNIDAVDNIPIHTLSNSAVEYAQTTPLDSASFCQSISFTESDTTFLMQKGGIEETFNSRNLYNPLDNVWIQMTPDISQYRWEAYGLVARNGRKLLSNTREKQTMISVLSSNESLEEDDIIEFDSDVPVSIDGQRITAVRKASKTTQWNVNAGLGIVITGVGHTHSESDYIVTTDFMDMNGDSYPDVVRTSTIQYTQPWGGLGENKNVNISTYTNHSISKGNSISGNYAYAVKAPGVNVKDGKFLSHVNGSIGGNRTSTYSEAAIAYMDVNGDGLPDKIQRNGNNILYCLNIGYGFAAPKTLVDVSQIDKNESVCTGGNLGVSGDLGWGDIKEEMKNILGTEHPTLTSKFQMSLAFGADINSAENKIISRLIDINGDGILDIVNQTNYGLDITLMSTQGINQQITIQNQTMQRSNTLSWGINAAITGGFPILFLKMCIGMNGVPKSGSTTQTTHDLIDMNGDGLPDLVWTEEDGIHVRYNQMGKNHLLKTITNPTGQYYQLDYELSSPTYEQRGRRWILNSVSNIDPYAHPVLGCDTILHTFSYIDPHYDYAERQFLGYGTTITHEINTDTLPHVTYRKTTRQYNNTDYIENGKLLYESLADANGNLFREYEIGTLYVDSTFTPTDNLCGDATIRVGTEVHYTRYYEGDTDRIVTAKKYEYDKYHNVKEYINFGDSTISNDDLRATILYDSTEIDTHNLISSPTNVVVYNNGIATKEIQADYMKGQIIELRNADLLYSNKDTTNYHYDSFGLPDSIIFPSNEKGERAYTAIIYDKFSHTLPATITDQWGRNKQITYDKFLKKPTTITDPTGKTIYYEYDRRGRLFEISAPNDKYEYTHYLNDEIIHYTERLYSIVFECVHSFEHSGIDYSFVITEIRANVGLYSKSSIFDSRGDIICHKEPLYDALTDKTLYAYTDLFTKDCFGRKKTSFCNFIDNKRNYEIFKTADSLITLCSMDFDILDRQTHLQWMDSTQQSNTYSLTSDAFGVKRLHTKSTNELGQSSHQFYTPQGWITTIIAPENAITLFRYNALGQLLSTTDPDKITTTYQYDGLGRLIERQHPDAGTTKWTYDRNGNVIANATQKQIKQGISTTYDYDYNRIKAIHFPLYPQQDITYEYDTAGHISKRIDITGYEDFQYDELGNISISNKLIVIPTEDKAYHFKTCYTYNSLGMIMDITYPDNEMVEYSYRAGKIQSISSRSYGNNPSHPYFIRHINYDAYMRPSEIETGNNYIIKYQYDPNRNWLTQQKTNKGETVLQDLHYTYDAVGNITSVEQIADSVRWLGGPYILDYQYDSLNRLTKADMVSDYFGLYSNYTMNYSPSGLVGLKSCDDMLWNYWYGYNTNSTGTLKNHQVRSIYDMENDETAFLQWDTDGQLQNILRPCSGDMRHHWWNEAGQMVAFADNERCGYYGYDGNGERIYKLTGQSVVDQYNAGEQNFQMFLNDAVLYVNPYMVVTPKGYTKHYYNGSQHIAAQIGKLEDLPDDIIDTSAVAMERIANARAYMNVILNISETQPIDSTSVFADIDGDALDELQWQCNDEEWTLNATVHCDSNMLQPILTKDSAHLDRRVSGIYYYHPDHLGSATWITNSSGVPIQFIHYMPWGEMWYNQQASAYNERFKFTGKERDTETGYDYFGARYYSSALPMWLSVDPLSDKYPNISPYAYCNWNPVNNIDIHGDSVSFSQVELFDKTCGTNTLENILNDLQSITGLTLSLNNGVLNYAKNENGDAVTNGGSETARNQLISLISNTKMANVGIGRRSLALNNDIILAPKQIDRFINGSMGVDSRTLGYGMTFLHESFHTNIGGGLKDNPNATGPVVDNMNLIRSELNNIGYNFGQRMSYSAIFTHGQNYIPFNNAAQNSLNAGLLPCTLFGMQFIHF